MKLESHEIEALIEYNREAQYAAARKEEYNDAEYHKRRAEEWQHFKGRTVAIADEEV